MGVDEGATRRDGDHYKVTAEEIEYYHTNGYVHLKGILSEDELKDLEKEYMAFLKREIKVDGRDFCDMSSDYSKPIEDFSIINILLPSKYNPRLKGSIYERRADSISRQLLGEGMVMDYDQLLAKTPKKPDGVFHWDRVYNREDDCSTLQVGHKSPPKRYGFEFNRGAEEAVGQSSDDHRPKLRHQDLAYWPVTKDSRTASFWLAIDNSSVENGCVQFIPGTHRETSLRPHVPFHGDRDKSHILAAKLTDKDVPKPAEINRGDVTVHHEKVIHGSGGNSSVDNWRRAWVIAYRSKETVEHERCIGFTHSHNDRLDVLNSVGKEEISV